MKKFVLAFTLLFVFAPAILAQNWWQVNSLRLDSIPNKVLFHAAGDYSLDVATGTISGFAHKSEAGFQVRKNRYLLNVSTDLKYQKLEMSSQVVREKYLLIEGALIYDLLPYLHAEVGAVWEKDDQQFIDQRLVVYTGLNVELFSSPMWGLNVMTAFGEQRQVYVVSPDVHVDWVGYAQQNFRIALHPKIIFTEKFIYVRELGDDSSYRNMLRLQTIFRFTPHFSALIRHETKYEQKPLFPSIEKLNHFQSIGLRFEI
ncbi:MAG: DUF481 domain-containing protein [Balneolales bacterium]|nr:DUF481 domain-containing protein [Balneolales bacterium]